MVIYPNLPPHSSFSKNWANHKKNIFNYYSSLEYFQRKIFHFKGQILVHVLLITHQSLPSRHLMKPLWNQCIWWQLKDTLNGNIHNAISFPFNPYIRYILSNPICLSSYYHQDHCYSPWQIIHRSWFKWDCEKLYRDQILWDISRGITTDCWWYQRPLYWVQHLTPFLPKQTLKGEARGCRDDIELFLRPKFEFKWCWTFSPQDGPMISLSYMKHDPVQWWGF